MEKGSQAKNDRKMRRRFSAKVDFGDLISYESQKSQVVKFTPHTPTLGLFRHGFEVKMGCKKPKMVSRVLHYFPTTFSLSHES